MVLEKIITLANSSVRIPFLAMERSLRATGCQLPIWVIPYNDQKFDLPENSFWWEMPDILNWLEENGNPRMKKYQCFTEANYQFVDPDIVFLRNPEEVLRPYCGFITSCGHWHSPHGQTYTEESLKILKAKSTTWQKGVFNSGQFACDTVLYTVDSLKKTCMQPEFVYTCLHYKKRDQFGINLLVNYAAVDICNLQFPPVRMESSWAGDYPDEHYTRYWKSEDQKPYLIHWAGKNWQQYRPIDQLFFNFLTETEKTQWLQQQQLRQNSIKPKYGSLQPIAVFLKKIFD